MIRYSRCKDTHQAVKKLIKDGWTYSVNGHGRITHPSGKYVTFSATPSDRHAFRNFEMDVRKVLKQVEREKQQ